MSNDAINWAYEQEGLSGVEKSVLVCLSNRERQGTCYPSQESIARDTSFTSRSVRSAITELTKSGLITIIKVGHKTVCTTYQVNFNVEARSAYEDSKPETPSTLEEPKPEARSAITGRTFHHKRKDVPTNPNITVIEPIMRDPKQSSITNQLSEEEQELINEFNTFCKTYGQVFPPNPDLDKKALRRILTDSRGTRPFTIQDIRDIGRFLWADHKACKDGNRDHFWLGTNICTFADLVKLTTGKVPYYIKLTKLVEAYREKYKL